MSRLSAAILAGGKSLRFGQDKALLRFYATILLDHIFKIISAYTSDIMIIGDYRKQSSVKKQLFIPDLIPGIGPAGGLYTALCNATSTLLIVPCDMPFISTRTLSLMVKRHKPDIDATIAVSPLGVEPLVAVYDPEIHPSLKKHIDHKEYALHKFIRSIHVEYVKIGENESNSNDFFNINTLSDYKKALYLSEQNQNKTGKMILEV